MSLLILVLVVIVILALAMWAIYYIPLPPGSPAFIKPFGYVVLIIIAILIIAGHSGVIGRL